MDTDRTEQLTLLGDDTVDGRRKVAWRLDAATCDRGLRGVAAARQALAAAAAARQAEAAGDRTCAA